MNKSNKHPDICPECGQEIIDKETQPMGIREKILTIVFGFITILFSLYVIDFVFFNDRYFNDFFLQEDCSFEVPTGWKIVSDGKMFAVKVDNKSDEYLYHGSRGINTMPSYIAEPSLFFNECKAKAYLKKYLEQNKPKITGFK